MPVDYGSRDALWLFDGEDYVFKSPKNHIDFLSYTINNGFSYTFKLYDINTLFRKGKIKKSPLIMNVRTN